MVGVRHNQRDAVNILHSIKDSDQSSVFDYWSFLITNYRLSTRLLHNVEQELSNGTMYNLALAVKVRCSYHKYPRYLKVRKHLRGIELWSCVLDLSRGQGNEVDVARKLFTHYTLLLHTIKKEFKGQ